MCRFHENTCDVEDNQVVRWTIFHLPGESLSEETNRELRANLHQFEPVTLKRPQRTVFDGRHYHRLNEDYRLIHSLCRLFLKGSSISERPGNIRFNGFLVDMNELFERFVTQAFVSCSQGSEFSVYPQEENQLSDSLSVQEIGIYPDVVVRRNDKVFAVIDAKYKKISGTFQNHDLYQVISYGTALHCASTYLLYPETECEFAGRIYAKNSPITIDILRVNIPDKHCVVLAEEVARHVLYAIRSSISSSGVEQN
jgi:5-methylcytosine-specific restriction enzyme subunit McrC